MSQEPEELWDLRPDQVLDVRREACPFPLVFFKTKMEQARPGTLLEALVIHPRIATETIPRICAEHGWPCALVKEWNWWRIRVRNTC